MFVNGPCLIQQFKEGRERTAPSNPEVIRINSIVDIAAKVEDYYLQGYVVGALHPILHPAGPRVPLPASHLYRAVLLRPKASPKRPAAPSTQRHPRLVIEECPIPEDMQARDIAKELIQKINAAARRGMRFVGFTPQLRAPPRCCNEAGRDAGAEPDDSWPGRGKGPGSGPVWEGDPGEESRREGDGSPSPSTPRKGEESMLYAVFNAFEDTPACWSYQEGVLSLKVTRKGAVLSTLDADWLELTMFYYKQGLSLIDSFVCWDSPKGDHLPKSLEGFFIYEEEGSGLPGSPRRENDAIVVEQWTVIEGTAVKADYGPLLHTLAEFGWLLTSVLPTPLLRRDREGNLATKQVVFLQRSAARPGARAPEASPSALPGRGHGSHWPDSAKTDLTAVTTGFTFPRLTARMYPCWQSGAAPGLLLKPLCVFLLCSRPCACCRPALRSFIHSKAERLNLGRQRGERPSPWLW
ncbi:raftlin-2 isoform X3 [Heterocephalus glaber]|uniref:Raftlin-2 isoform X3 n=1 Tax=Heterocephalus glaber TaxID=10181 RepID=A0AAX6S8U5_HETGA|nr:raftlin-2 isoform X3 [Heterocephalus glaber]XP_021105393.1 raftlin-2 isoform X3 [Heterocephalus glaber]